MPTRRSPSERARRRPPHAAARPSRRTAWTASSARPAPVPTPSRSTCGSPGTASPVLTHDPIPWRTSRGRSSRSAGAGPAPSTGSGCGPTAAGRPASPPPIDALPAGLKVAVDVKDGRSMAAAIDVLAAAGRLADALLWSSHRDAVRVAAERAPDVERAWLQNTTTPRCGHRLLPRRRRARREGGQRDGRVAHAGGGGDRPRTSAWSSTPGCARSRCRTRSSPAGPDGIVTDWVAEARASIGSIS